MAKVKNWTILILTVFVLITAWQLKSMTDKRNSERSDKEQWQSNYMEANKTARENKNIVLKQKEFLSQKDDRIYRLIDSLNIKPKTVTKYVERVIIQHETDTINVVTEKIATGVYKISDSGPCFTWTGIATIAEGSPLEIKRTGFDYQNKFKEITINRTLKGKFLFFKVWDKKKADVKIIPECGDEVIKTVNIIK